MSKFNSLRDEVVYGKCLEGWHDAEIGDAATFGWFALVMDFHGKSYIVSEDSVGFVEVDSYDDSLLAQLDWAMIEADAHAFYGDEVEV